jgi:hypothetical protein
MSTQLTVEAWADIVIKEWHKKIEKYNIGSTGQLSRSFVHHILSNAGGDPSRIEFAFEYYGKFVDWGVGKGVTIPDLTAMQSAGLTKRKQKPWFTEVFYLQVQILAQELSSAYAQATSVIIAANLESLGVSEKGMTKAKTPTSSSRKQTGNTVEWIDKEGNKRTWTIIND